MATAISLHLKALRDTDSKGFMAASIASSFLIFFIFISTFSSSKSVEDVSDILREQRYLRSTRLQLVDQNEIAVKLQRIMEEQEPYLNSNLRITDLARKLSLNGPQLSEFINRHLSTNFNCYINDFRVEKAKQLLTDEPHMDITNIAYDSGFNSISSFNAAFKKKTNMTPGRFRKQHAELPT
jgi:YesN/AraC family two-component response regulator